MPIPAEIPTSRRSVLAGKINSSSGRHHAVPVSTMSRSESNPALTRNAGGLDFRWAPLLGARPTSSADRAALIHNMMTSNDDGVPCPKTRRTRRCGHGVRMLPWQRPLRARLPLDRTDPFSEEGALEKHAPPWQGRPKSRSADGPEIREVNSFGGYSAGETLESWNSAWVPIYRLVVRPVPQDNS